MFIVAHRPTRLVHFYTLASYALQLWSESVESRKNIMEYKLKKVLFSTYSLYLHDHYWIIDSDRTNSTL